LNPGVGRKILSLFRSNIISKWNSDNLTGYIFRNMAMLTSGTAVARVIGFASVPIITRLYSPEHIGVLSIFTALTALLVPFGTLRYTMAIPLPKHEALAINLMVMCGLLLLISSMLIFFLFLLFASSVLGVFSMDKLLPYWWLLPIAFAGTSLYELLANWAIRERAFGPLAKTRVWQSAIGVTVKIVLGLLGIKPLGLLLGQVFTQAGGVVSLLKNVNQKLKPNFKRVSRERVAFLLKRYADFPKYRLSSQFLLILSSQAPLLFFGWQFGAAATGQLGLALTMIALPMTLFGQTTALAYYAEITKIGRKNPREIYEITKSITKKLFLMSIAPFLVFLFLGPWLFGIVFGDLWREAGFFASILAISLLMEFASSPVVNVINVFENQRIFLMINLVRVVGTVTIFSISYSLLLSPNATMIVYSIGLSAHYIFTAYMVFRVIKCAKA
jgi:O-antigen/teichoic acid export membrane protein